MKKIRTFIAHPAPEEWIEIIGEALPTLREGLNSRVSWVKPENMHFTLKFLGSVEEEKLTGVDQVLKNIPVDNFKISAAGAGFFPGPENPYTIWIGIAEGTNQFCSTAAAVETGLKGLGFRPNKKSCHAHLTLGRVKRQAADDWKALAEKINHIGLPEAHLSIFNLYKSVLTPDGPVYSVLKKYS
jgi:2'-5' RNA ligase